MPWSIVQIYKKNKKKIIEPVPETWIKKQFVYWPLRNQISLQRDENSQIDLDEWEPYAYKILLENLTTFEEGDEKANILRPTESDVEVPPTKRKKFCLDNVVCDNMPTVDVSIS